MTDTSSSSSSSTTATNDAGGGPDRNYNNNHNSNSNFTSHSRSDGGMLAPSLRILCLHDGHSNAGELSDQLEVLGERLYEKHMIDLVYVNAPLLANNMNTNNNSSEEEEEGDNDDCDGDNIAYRVNNPLNKNSNPQRLWYEHVEVDATTSLKEEEEEEPASSAETATTTTTLPPQSSSRDNKSSPPKTKTTTTTTKNMKFVGLDASILLLRQIWNSMPFWGVLAVGQGAAAASFLPLLPLSTSPQFMIFVRGESLLEETELLVDDALSHSCLHLMAATPSESSERLLRQFGGRVFTGVTKTFTSKTLNVIGKFLVDQKKSLRTSNLEAGNILVLQNHLYLAEQEAANAVAQRIAMDPPKALMAVISPQNVGGWSGGKRRAPNEEGGGAPCPSDFLLRREKRTTDPQGPTREHPNNATNTTEEEVGASDGTNDTDQDQKTEELKGQ